MKAGVLVGQGSPGRKPLCEQKDHIEQRSINQCDTNCG